MEAVSILRGLSYEYRGDAGAEGGHVLVRGPEPLVRTHHLHVVDLGGSQWGSYLLLRDFLRNHPHARDAYATAKAALAQRYPNDREAYTAGKNQVVQRLLSEARRPTRRIWTPSVKLRTEAGFRLVDPPLTGRRPGADCRRIFGLWGGAGGSGP